VIIILSQYKMFNEHTTIYDNVIDQYRSKRYEDKGFLTQVTSLYYKNDKPLTFNHDMTVYDMMLMQQDDISSHSNGAMKSLANQFETELHPNYTFVENLMWLNQLTKKGTRNYNPTEEKNLGFSKSEYEIFKDSLLDNEVKEQVNELEEDLKNVHNQYKHWCTVEKFKGSKLKYLQQLQDIYESNDIDPKYPMMDNIELSKVDDKEIEVIDINRIGPIINYDDEELEEASNIEGKNALEGSEKKIESESEEEFVFEKEAPNIKEKNEILEDSIGELVNKTYEELSKKQVSTPSESEDLEVISPIKPKIVIEEEEEEEIKDVANVIGFELKGLKKGYDFVSPTKQYQNEIKSINTPSRQGYNYLTPVKKPVEQKIVAPKVKIDELTLMKQMDKPKPRSMWERMKEVFDLV
jgi:hypothetical protein